MLNRLFIRTRGGRISVKRLDTICKSAIRNQIQGFRLSSRQELVMDEVDTEGMKTFKAEMLKNEIEMYATSTNAVSSLMSVGVFSTTSWLNQGVFSKVITDLPKLNRNVSFVDPKQEYVPLLDSYYNFIADEQLNYWYLVIRTKERQKPYFTWPVRIGTNAIPEFIHLLEEKINVLGEEDMNLISEEINSTFDYDNLSYLEDFSLKNQNFNLQDGFYGLEPSFLFVYLDRYRFTSLDMLLSNCNAMGMDYVYFSPWKSIMVGPIPAHKKQKWYSFLNLENLKTGRAYQELNWRLERIDEPSLKLKKKLISFFNQTDLRVNGLSFSICRDFEMAKNANFLIRIRKHKFLGLVGVYDLMQTHKKAYKVLGERLSLRELKSQLISAITNHQKSLKAIEMIGAEDNQTKNTEKNNFQYGCTDCLTLYLPEMGEPKQEIAPNTPFESLSDKFYCPTCGGKKDNFVQMDMQTF